MISAVVNKSENKSKEYNIIMKCLEQNNKVLCYSNHDSKEFITELFNNIVPFERPDMYSRVKNDLIIIEHFEFDSYKNNRKGSDFRVNEKAVIRDASKKLENMDRSKEIIIRGKVESSASKENYVNNFTDVFSTHYNSINDYKQRISDKDCKSIKTCFFIEDVSPLGGMYLTKGRPHPITIFNFEIIIDFLEAHSNVD